MGFVFLSHNSSDKPAVEEIARRLLEHGIEPWLDSWKLAAGERWQPALEKALAQAQASVVFFGPSGMGPWQEEEMRVAIDQRIRDADYRVIPVLLPGALRGRRSLVPAFMANVTWVEFRHSLNEEVPFSKLVAGIRGMPPPRATGSGSAQVNPYCGLRHFDVGDAGWFFGREALTEWLVSDIRNSLATRAGVRFLAIAGPSGSGKSSLARAGLLAALRNGVVEGSRDWRCAVFKPGTHPLEALALAVAEPLNISDGLSVTRFTGELSVAARLLHIEASLALRNEHEGARLLLLVDQFEELFTLCRSEAERACFIGNLLEAASAVGGSVVVVVTIRSDFIGHCAAYERLAAALSDHQQLVGPMQRQELREAIEQPAFMTGVEFEPGLVDALLKDVHARPGALPLLQHALFELWRERDGRRLTHSVYERIGGVQGALARRADDVYRRLESGEQDVARRVLLRLTQPGEGTEDTRRRAPVEEIATSAGDREHVERVVRQLADERLLVTDNGTVEVAHEALISNWPQLRVWIEDRRSALRFHRRITEAAMEWQRLARDDGLLFRGVLLEDARRWRARIAADLNEVERSFLDASDDLARHTLAEDARQRAVSDRMLWLQWVLANAAGLALGMLTLTLLMAGLHWLASGFGDFPPASAPVVVQYLAAALACTLLGSGTGAVIGAAQWMALSRAFPQLSPTRWIVASAVGAAIGMMILPAVVFALSSPQFDGLGSGPFASHGPVVAGTLLVLLWLFVRHRHSVTAPWSRRRKLLHGLGAGVIVVSMLPLLVLNRFVELDHAHAERPIAASASSAAALGNRPAPVRQLEIVSGAPSSVVASVATLLGMLVALLCWHHWSEAAPRSLGRSDLYGLFIAVVILALFLSFLLRIDSFFYPDGSEYGLPHPSFSVWAMTIFGAAIGTAQVWVQRRHAMVRAGVWILSCAVGMALGTAVMGILIPGLGPSIAPLFRANTARGDALLVFFFPAGVLLGAVTGRHLLANRRPSPSRA